MKRLFQHIHKVMKAAAVALLATALPSCDAIYEEEGDCEPHYYLTFKFTKNILNADAFGSQVSDIHAAVYDKEGHLLFTQSDIRQLSEDNTYRMPVDLQPGEYDVIAWCEGQAMTPGAVSFTLKGLATYDLITSTGAYFDPLGTPGNRYFQSDLRALFYGRSENIVCDPEDYGDIDLPAIPLTKDTNTITVMLQNLGGQPLDPDMLTFTIKGENSALDWKNNLTDTETDFDYHPWDTQAIIATEDPGSRADMPNGVKAEFSTSRLIADREQRLIVSNNDSGEEIISIPLIEYLLLVRGNYQQATSPQDYLDRCDAYSLTFFVDENMQWIKTRVLINGWRVVPPQHEVITGN